MRGFRRFVGVTVVLATGLAMSGCQWFKHSNDDDSAASNPPGITIPSTTLPTPEQGSEKITLSPAQFIPLRMIAGVAYIPVIGAYSDTSFRQLREEAAALRLTPAEVEARTVRELSANIEKIKAVTKVIEAKVDGKIAYFNFSMPLADFSRLAQVQGLSRRLLINPEVHFVNGLAQLGSTKVTDEDSLGLPSGRGDTAAFSGLARIGVPTFLDKVAQDIGEQADGANVLVGVTDTGVTLHHPAFENAKGEVRIRRLREMTGEGTLYFSSTAKFAVTPIAGKDDLLQLDAEVLRTVVGVAQPIADQVDTLNLTIRVSPALRALLTAADANAKAAIFSEASLKAPDLAMDQIDINHNGKTDDQLLVLLVPGKNGAPTRLYFDPVPVADHQTDASFPDFTRFAPVGDWNQTKETLPLFSETVGFEIGDDLLSDSKGNDVKVIKAGLVGYDPGGHGSHVSGIIGARKIIQNDSDSTLARGVAPDVSLMVNRVCANNGGCSATAAIVDLAENGAEVVNMSIGGLSNFDDGYDVQGVVINRLTQVKNTLFVISAGNDGSGHQTVAAPSVSDLALSVAATASRSMIERQYQYPAIGKPVTPSKGADDDFVLFFSGRGPTAAGGFKPNIAAPGTELSSYKLNTAPGDKAGLQIMWGTSMAAPTATGAVALLLDAAKRYNAKNPGKELPIDALTLRRVIQESAKAFDVNKFNPKTKKYTAGQYTWIDEGLGLIDLPHAWDVLKAERDQRIASSVKIKNADGSTSDVAVQYEVRSLMTMANGLPYDGTQTVVIDAQGTTLTRYGRGVYFDVHGAQSLFTVQVLRSLPASVLGREDLGELQRQLITTADEFALETEIYGSKVEWVKAGTLNQAKCQASREDHLTVVGTGAVEVPGGASTPSSESSLFVCVDRSLVNQLQPGDHGAIVKAYRVAGGQREASPSFIVPVYVTVPNGILAGGTTFRVEEDIPSFAVRRHYVEIPKGTSLVKIRMEVPEAVVNGNVVDGCSGVLLTVLEGLNTGIPPELDSRPKSIAVNCNANGTALTGSRVVEYTRENPRPGLWDMNLFGRYTFSLSHVVLSVDFIKVKSSLNEVTGDEKALTGAFDITVLDGSLAFQPALNKSSYILKDLLQEVTPSIQEGDSLSVPTKAGKVFRSYSADVVSATFETGGAPGDDIDLFVRECDKEDASTCTTVGKSTGSTDVERVSVDVKAGKFYVAQVDGYSVKKANSFILRETLERQASLAEAGQLTVQLNGSTGAHVDFAFAADKSALLQDPLFISGDYSVVGSLVLRNTDGASLFKLPFEIQHAK